LTAVEIAEVFADYLIRGLLAKPDSLRRPFSATKATKMERPVRKSLLHGMNQQAEAARFSRR
jgi:hypothetical protein